MPQPQPQDTDCPEKSDAAQDKQTRQAEALRQNLLRRKQQQRSREEAPTETSCGEN